MYGACSCVREIEDAYVLLESLKESDNSKRPRRRWKYNIRFDLTDTGLWVCIEFMWFRTEKGESIYY
jgi:hypothetical protein